jgi:transmembrane protein TMEM260 (protein O-mannosyltransferase)
MRPRAALPTAALVCALAAFGLYRATLLPGFDLGDTGSLQTMAGESLITPRDGYPLYFAIGSIFVRLTATDPAHAMNLASAVEGAIACGLFVLVAARLSGSVPAAAAAALLFAASYTFWSQAIIAEVYALHAVCMLLSLLALLEWAERPSTRRLALFFAVYAIGFGNHLSMILLLPGYAVFLLASAPGGWRSMLRPRVVLLATAFACVGAAQYLWNLRTLWFQPQPPPDLWSALRLFWFDVTKADWRETMVLRVPRSMLADHVAMYWFDLRQQFGPGAPLLAIVGLVGLALSDLRRAALLLLIYLANVLFAFSYNVGDAHVFYLPSHLLVALLAAVGVRRAARAIARFGSPVEREGVRRAFGAALALVLALYAAARAYHDFPALDRTEDRRPSEVIERLTAGLDDRRAILLEDLNWQMANGLSYYTKVVRPEVAVGRLPDVMLYLPALVADNAQAGRDVAVTDRARAAVDEAYGPLAPTVAASRTAITPLARLVEGLPSGTRYVLCLLKPSRDFPLDRADLAAALRTLAGARGATLPEDDYAAVAGRIGAPPDLAVTSNRPFRREVQIGGVPVEIRMEAWLAADTIRRMGFGHVVAARHHALIVERGVSFVVFDDRGRPIRTAYAANLFAPEPRYLIRTADPACYRC